MLFTLCKQKFQQHPTYPNINLQMIFGICKVCNEYATYKQFSVMCTLGNVRETDIKFIALLRCKCGEAICNNKGIRGCMYM